MLNQHLHQRQQLLQLGWVLWVLKWVDWLFWLAGTSLMAIQLTRKLTYSMRRFSHINAAPMFPEDILLRRTPAPNRSYVTQVDSWQLKGWCNAAFFIWNFHQLPSDQPSMPLVQMSIRTPDMAMWKSLRSRRCFSSSTVTSVENLFPDSYSQPSLLYVCAHLRHITEVFKSHFEMHLLTFHILNTHIDTKTRPHKLFPRKIKLVPFFRILYLKPIALKLDKCK